MACLIGRLLKLWSCDLYFSLYPHYFPSHSATDIHYLHSEPPPFSSCIKLGAAIPLSLSSLIKHILSGKTQHRRCYHYCPPPFTTVVARKPSPLCRCYLYFSVTAEFGPSSCGQPRSAHLSHFSPPILTSLSQLLHAWRYQRLPQPQPSVSRLSRSRDLQFSSPPSFSSISAVFPFSLNKRNSRRLPCRPRHPPKSKYHRIHPTLPFAIDTVVRESSSTSTCGRMVSGIPSGAAPVVSRLLFSLIYLLYVSYFSPHLSVFFSLKLDV